MTLTDRQIEFASQMMLFRDHCISEVFPVKIYSYIRTLDEQARLFRQGRSLAQIQARAETLDYDLERPDLASILMGVGPQSGDRIVTSAAPGQSLHNYGLAFDCVPLQMDRAVWNDNLLWERIGKIAKLYLMDWGGDWVTMRDKPHCQLSGISWRDVIT